MKKLSQYLASPYDNSWFKIQIKKIIITYLKFQTIFNDSKEIYKK